MSLSKTLYPLLGTGSARKDVSRHDKNVDWNVKNQTKARHFVVVDSLLIVTPIVGICNCSMFCCALLYVHSSFSIILMGKRELVALLFFVYHVSRDCCVALPHGAAGLSAVCHCGIS